MEPCQQRRGIRKHHGGKADGGMEAMFDTTFLFSFFSSEIYLFRKIAEIENYTLLR